MTVSKLRNKLGLTLESFARLVGVSWVTVQRWESGKSNPQEKNWARMEQLNEETKTDPDLLYREAIKQIEQGLNMLKKFQNHKHQ